VRSLINLNTRRWLGWCGKHTDMDDKTRGGPGSRFIGVVRIAVACIWIYEGLWKKVLMPDPHELEIVQSAAHVLGVSGAWPLSAIGFAETALAVVVFAGTWFRAVAVIQAAVLIGMNASGILLGGGAISKPADLLIHNVPLLLCIALVGLYGPGEWAPIGTGVRKGAIS